MISLLELAGEASGVVATLTGNWWLWWEKHRNRIEPFSWLLLRLLEDCTKCNVQCLSLHLIINS